MPKGPQLRPSEQRKRLQHYLSTLRANFNRACRELFEISRIRKGCPFERALRYRRFEAAVELLEVGKKCVAEINHCYALRLAAFRPGDHLLVETTLRGFPPDPRRYLVLDVEWRKRDEYTYVVHELTKSGALHKGRYSTWLSPSNRVSIEYCDEPLPDETRWRGESARRAAVALLEAVLENGELSMFPPKLPAPSPPVERRYPFWTRGMQ
jgi:hypothetical protein